mmetsp:Transcript_30122/g.68507  ORF Transcript_30122/g.68507 Transcript_30122/m.68507 type:complete len:208 (-) Transcript_30122:589-1212(-)
MLGQLRDMRQQLVHHRLHGVRWAPLEHVLQHPTPIRMLGHADRAPGGLGEQQSHAARVALLGDQLGDVVAVGVVDQGFQVAHQLGHQHLAELGVADLQCLLQQPASVGIHSQLRPVPRELRHDRCPGPWVQDQLAQRLLPPLMPRQLRRQPQHRGDDLPVPDVGLHPLPSVGAAGSMEHGAVTGLWALGLLAPLGLGSARGGARGRV